MNADTGPASVLSVRRLSAGYKGRQVLQEVSFDVAAGEALGLAGTSGAGKSTLVLAVLGLLGWRGGYTQGEVLFEGINLLAAGERAAQTLRGKRFALVPQSPLTALNSAVSLRTHFYEAWRAHAGRGERAACERRISELLEQVQLPAGASFLNSRPGEISVGQAQRVLIALALLHRPALLIADEPTSALDPLTQREVVALLGRLHRETGTALLYISHDLVSVLQLCERLAVLERGTIVEAVTIADIEQGMHQHAATRSLLAALPAPPAVLRAYRPQHGAAC